MINLHPVTTRSLQVSLILVLGTIVNGFTVNSCLLADTIFRVSDVSELHRVLQKIAGMREAGKREPVTIQLADGTYTLKQPLRFTPQLVGAGLTMKATKRHAAVISGGIALTVSRPDRHNRWRFPLPKDWKTHGVPRAILIDGFLRTAARWPNRRLDNNDYLRIEKSLADRRSGFTTKTGDLPSDFQVGHHICDLVFLHDWSSSRLQVQSFDPTKRVLLTTGPIGCNAAHYAIDHFEKQPRYWLEGHPAFADQPGEWFVDMKTGEIVVIGDVKSNKPPVVIVPRLKELLLASGTEDRPLENFSLQGLRFTASRFPMPPGGLAGSQATKHEPRSADGKRIEGARSSMLSAAVTIQIAKGSKVIDCRFESIGGSGLWIGSRTKKCLVDRCRFQYIGGNAINIGEDNSRRVDGQSWYRSAPGQVPTGNRITRCAIRNCGELLPGAVAVWGGLNRQLEIDHNRISDCPYTGISLGWIWNDSPSPARDNRIHHNRIEYVMQMLSDGGGIYTLGQQAGTIVEHNSIADISTNLGRAESNGMFIDEGSTGLTIRENTIRRVARSPLRFHKAGKNLVTNNRWELFDKRTPPVRFNATPRTNIAIVKNEALEKQPGIFLIGNSLTWDTVPSLLDGNVHWHVDCGKSLPFMRDNPEDPCVDSSRIWPYALARTQYDIVSIQPHYGSTLDQDVSAISQWMTLQPKAKIVIHTGWARSATRAEEYAEDSIDKMTHSPGYMTALIHRLRKLHPKREVRQTHAIDLLDRIARDIESGDAPIKNIGQLHRDSIHMTVGGGRYLMHNAMRKALGQPRSSTGFRNIDKDLKEYLDGVMKKVLR